MRWHKPVLILNVTAGLIFAAVLVLTVARPPALEAATAATASSPPGQSQQAPATLPKGYVGADTCVTCHTGYDTAVNATKHGMSKNARTPMGQMGCESCHGPGEAHMNDPGKVKPVQFNKVSTAEANAVCTTCHDRAKHALWEGSQHDQRNVQCVSCHSVHNSKSARAMLKAADESQLCATCHAPIVKKLNRFNHMPVREGKMQCSSCHNTHGSTNVKLLKNGTTVDEACTTCHAEKRGPYLWEHAPVSNSCVTCHDPHGSNNDRMLAAKVPFLCQRCHVTSRHPPTVYDGYLLNNSNNGNKIYGKGCVNCHQQIHGSNHPNGQMFLR